MWLEGLFFLLLAVANGSGSGSGSTHTHARAHQAGPKRRRIARCELNEMRSPSWLPVALAPANSRSALALLLSGPFLDSQKRRWRDAVLSHCFFFLPMFSSTPRRSLLLLRLFAHRGIEV